MHGDASSSSRRRGHRAAAVGVQLADDRLVMAVVLLVGSPGAPRARRYRRYRDHVGTGQSADCRQPETTLTVPDELPSIRISVTAKVGCWACEDSMVAAFPKTIIRQSFSRAQSLHFDFVLHLRYIPFIVRQITSDRHQARLPTRLPVSPGRRARHRSCLRCCPERRRHEEASAFAYYCLVFHHKRTRLKQEMTMFCARQN